MNYTAKIGAFVKAPAVAGYGLWAVTYKCAKLSTDYLYLLFKIYIRAQHSSL